MKFENEDMHFVKRGYVVYMKFQNGDIKATRSARLSRRAATICWPEHDADRRIASVRDAAIRAPLRRHVRRRPCFLCSTRVLYHVHTIHVSHVLIHVSHMFYAFHMLYALHTHDAGLSSNRNSNYHVIRLEAYHPLI